MTAKRLTFEVSAELHAQLKSEAAQQGIHLGPYCAAILEGRGEQSPSPSVEKVDVTAFSAMPLTTLRDMRADLASTQPKDWKRTVTAIDSEIRRRFRT